VKRTFQPITCAVCGVAFTPKADKQKCCSRPCGIKSTKEALRVKTPANDKVKR